MTCIVGLVEDGRMYIGGDSLGVGPGLDVSQRKDVKVFKKGNMLFGYTSSYRMGQLLRFKLSIPAKIEGQDDYEYMCTTMMDAIRLCLKSNGYTRIKENEELIGTFLVGYNNQIYVIEDDLQVGMQYASYDSVGCGHVYALAAMFAIEKCVGLITSSKVTPRDKITLALEAAEEFSGGVRRPFVIEEL